MVRPGIEESRAAAGDALAKAFEMVVTPAIFGVGGWFVDGFLGTFPVVTVAAVLVVLTYQVSRFVRDYGSHMDDALASRRTGYGALPTRSTPPTAPTPPTPPTGSKPPTLLTPPTQDRTSMP